MMDRVSNSQYPWQYPIHLKSAKGSQVVGLREVFLEKIHGCYAYYLCGDVTKTNHDKGAKKFFWGVVYAQAKN